VIVVDDLLATGGTAKATVNLLDSLGASVIGVSFLIELTFLNGRRHLDGHPVHVVMSYDE